MEWIWAVAGMIAGAVVTWMVLGPRYRRRVETVEGEMVRKDDALAAASHELRTPLTSVVGFAHTLAEQDIDAPERAELLSMIVDEAEAMHDIVEDLLVISGFKRGVGIHVTIEDIESLAVEVRAVLDRTAGLGRVRITGEASARADVRRLRQILRNLLANATEHGDAPVTVIISDDGEAAHLVVRDGGPGMSPELAATVFDPRTARPNPAARHSTGVGLWLSRQLAERMDGTLTYRSGTEGSEFELVLPRK